MFLEKYSSELVTGVISLVVGYFLHKITSQRPKVVSYLSSVSDFVIQNRPPNANFSVYTHSITIQNLGNGIAHNVIVGHSTAIVNFRVFPNIPFRTETTPQGAWIIKFDNLGPRQFITISYLYSTPMTVDQINQFVRFDEGEGRIIRVIPVRAMPRILVWIYNFVAFIGLLTIGFGLYKVLLFLWHLFIAVAPK